jgi:hypothetical protein
MTISRAAARLLPGPLRTARNFAQVSPKNAIAAS